MSEQYLITLDEWKPKRFSLPITNTTLVKYGKLGYIVPRPQKIRGRWLIDRRAVFVGPGETGIAPEIHTGDDDALLQLREFIDENSGEFFVQVWGNGANFDNTILRRSYERQGIPCPWRYYNDRDVRTIVELGKAIDFDARTAIPFEGERHNALDDARYQAKYVSVIWQKLIPSQADS